MNMASVLRSTEMLLTMPLKPSKNYSDNNEKTVENLKTKVI
jgi:hypothetical protein